MRWSPSGDGAAKSGFPAAGKLLDSRLRDTATAARSVLDCREHDGILGRVGKPIPSRTKQNIKK
jgi:hypothetical protein